MRKSIILSFIFFSQIINYAQIIYVPADYTTIQQGIDAAMNGDTVIVESGTYFENINFKGKAITVASNFIFDGDTNSINNTIINGSQPADTNKASVVTFDSGEDTNSVLNGFTITGGTGTLIQEGSFDHKAGGGIIFNMSGGKILNNYIEFNEVQYQNLTMGGGICAGGPISPLPWLILKGNKIRHNKSISQAEQANSGGVEVYCNLIMVDNKVNNNETISPIRAITGGVSIRFDFGQIDINVRNNLITQNKSVSNTALTTYSKSGGLFIGKAMEAASNNKNGICTDEMIGLTGTFSNNTVSFNELEVAEDKNCYGAGVMIGYAGTDFMFENNFIINNYCSGGTCYGGGLCVFFGGGTYQNNVIQDNIGAMGGGISVGLNNNDSLAILINNTITANKSSQGGGLHLLNANAVSINSIFWDNEATVAGEGIFATGSNLDVSYSNVQGDEIWPGNGNKNIDPEFEEDGYHLSWASTLINQGIDSTEIGNEWYVCPENDIDGDVRPYSSTLPDIGADETPLLTDMDENNTSEDMQIATFPNPLTTSTTLTYTFSEPSTVTISIFNPQGQLIERIEQEQCKGEQQVHWNAEGLPAGMYYFRIHAGEKLGSGKMVKIYD